MWVTTTDGDLVDVRGAWIARTSVTKPQPFRILAKFPVGAEYGGSRFASVTLGSWDHVRERDRVYAVLAKALRDGEPDMDMSNP